MSVSQRTPSKPLKPASALESWEINQYVPEGSDGRLWYSWEIPIFMDQPTDQSNRDAIDSIFGDEIADGEAVRNINTLYLKVFDDRDERGNLIDFRKVEDLPRTEGFDKLVNIVEILEEGDVIDDHDYRFKADAYAVSNLAAMCVNDKSVWEGNVPADWAVKLADWMEDNGMDYDEDSYQFDYSEVIRGLSELGFLNPDCMRSRMDRDGKARLLELDNTISEAEKMWEALEELNPRMAQRYSEQNAVEMSKLKGVRDRFLLGLPDPKQSVSDPGQLELPLDDRAVDHNREIETRIENDYILKLKDILNAAAKDLGESLDFDDDDEFVFASSNRMMACGRERRSCCGITVSGRQRRSGER